MKHPPQPDKPAAELSIVCGKCGLKHLRLVRHWETFQCNCGERFIALEPTRNGPLQLFAVKPLQNHDQ